MLQRDQQRRKRNRALPQHVRAREIGVVGDAEEPDLRVVVRRHAHDRLAAVLREREQQVAGGERRADLQERSQIFTAEVDRRPSQIRTHADDAGDQHDEVGGEESGAGAAKTGDRIADEHAAERQHLAREIAQSPARGLIEPEEQREADVPDRAAEDGGRNQPGRDAIDVSGQRRDDREVREPREDARGHAKRQQVRHSLPSARGVAGGGELRHDA